MDKKTALDLEKKFLDLIQTKKFDFQKPAIPDKIYLKINDSIIGTTGNFITLTGLPKAGKSAFISCIIASAVSKSSDIDDVFGFKFIKHKGKEKIILFDTEQGNFDFQNQIKRIKSLSQNSNIEKNFEAFLFREDDAKNIIAMIHFYLKTVKNVGAIIIDGLLDLIDNMNDEGASKRLIRTLKRWAVKNDILIITVLHLGKKDLSSIGHIGSACDRYAQSVLSIEKTKDGNYRCASKFLRSSKDFEPVEIYRDKITGDFFQIT